MGVAMRAIPMTGGENGGMRKYIIFVRRLFCEWARWKGERMSANGVIRYGNDSFVNTQSRRKAAITLDNPELVMMLAQSRNDVSGYFQIPLIAPQTSYHKRQNIPPYCPAAHHQTSAVTVPFPKNHFHYCSKPTVHPIMNSTTHNISSPPL